MIALFGRFKGEPDIGGIACPFVIAIEVDLLHRRVMVQKRSEGWLFKKGKRRANLSDFDEMLDHYVRQIHGLYLSLLSVGTILEMFSTWRSMRRGAVIWNTGRIDEAVVNLMNRWRTKKGVGGTTPGLNMQQMYTQSRDVFLQLKLYVLQGLVACNYRWLVLMRGVLLMESGSLFVKLRYHEL